ncbi:hypothetical protein A3H03_03335 [Candidatus Kuenenbacteria bacterium RIFCSPLOWO2_12_FULL_42_13]|uniref:Retron-type reverse transcriptase n=3 Tax=Candidatus Kueneniibacteriota TaxID=1752740 RepID=A0A0G1BYZ1_9BACT|nr:MAG: Retron-type reverse transcriptase [Candidatus Kuenenbacteria bacterium GW2011_GWA2_42_15]OGG90040.1 MAG: hypothetical protein A3C68_00970 [Candidatus Kuenenbacteria bacterium RIFCSPHIGHO2_02_FULL_42_29]OGG91691.1 MAG: hypothetical protein A3H55_03460 [Candidatus Kuenenbacteria bacterium RIFCSPLOWO2_02_FULL_42_16]OGG92482.1 MAG: hypothetical protein A3H03_03335 [Candidatus Kuenenbacteria bacterium RIFCSPLOWO2_12_FULL_42_13]
MKIQLTYKYEEIVSIDNLLLAWQEFLRGKRKKYDIQEFSLRLMDNLFSLHRDLIHHTYKHGGYQEFKINDPKPRVIHKAAVSDRLVHHALHRLLSPFFDKIFIADSYSCRRHKGTHRAANGFRKYFYQASQNNTTSCWVLKCDIRKFFANIDHQVLTKILTTYIPDKNILKLLETVIESFSTIQDKRLGLPLGNLTSQLFANIYLNTFDQFIKHNLKAKFYLRYADDFVFLSADKDWLEKQISEVGRFLSDELKLELHPDKIFLKTLASGVDFLGLVNFPDHRILRTSTKRRMIRKIKEKEKDLAIGLIGRDKFYETVNSYLGMLKHCCGEKIRREINKD